jgi:hypothetical protein
MKIKKQNIGIYLMFKKNKFVLSVLLAFIATTSISYAEVTIWEFRAGTANYEVEKSGYYFGNQLSIDSDNDGTPELTIQAWADTGCGWNCGIDSELGQGYASTNSSGLLNYNLDASNKELTGEEHVIDNKDGDVDMMLFTFAESTALTGIDIGWFNNDSDVSIAAFTTLPTLEGNNWSNIASQSIFSASFSNLGTAPYTLVNEISNVVVEAKYWLIGAYSSIFGDSGANDNHSDQFKIASITTQTSDVIPSDPDVTEVAEPSTIAIFASFGLFLMWRRKKTA